MENQFEIANAIPFAKANELTYDLFTTMVAQPSPIRELEQGPQPFLI